MWGPFFPLHCHIHPLSSETADLDCLQTLDILVYLVRTWTKLQCFILKITFPLGNLKRYAIRPSHTISLQQSCSWAAAIKKTAYRGYVGIRLPPSSITANRYDSAAFFDFSSSSFLHRLPVTSGSEIMKPRLRLGEFALNPKGMSLRGNVVRPESLYHVDFFFACFTWLWCHDPWIGS